MSFSDFVFARMLITSAAITAVALALAATATTIRLATSLAVPGWATNVVGFSVIILSEALLFSMVVSLTMLRNRSAAEFVPSAHAGIFVGDRLVLFENSPMPRGDDDPVR